MRSETSPATSFPAHRARWITALLVTLLFSLLLRDAALAGDNLELELVDGTVIHGTLNSFTDGVYTVTSDTLGTLRIEAAKVKSLRSGGAPESGPEHLQTLQTRMARDAEVMALIDSLQQDPDFQEVLSDKELMRAISAGDLRSLENNPKMKKLLNKSTVRDIGQKLQQ